MFFNDPIADLLTRVRNAQAARKAEVTLPYSKIKESIAVILKDNDYIEEVSVKAAGGFKNLHIKLKADRTAITSIIRVSKPGRRVYSGAAEIPAVLGGRGLMIVSTSSGLMSGRQARQKGLGGELICKVW